MPERKLNRQRIMNGFSTTTRRHHPCKEEARIGMLQPATDALHSCRREVGKLNEAKEKHRERVRSVCHDSDEMKSIMLSAVLFARNSGPKNNT